MSFETMLTPERIDRHTSAGHWVDCTITDNLDQYTDEFALVNSRRQVTFSGLPTQDRAALELSDRGARRALATMWIGVGQDISVVLEGV